MAKRSKLHGVQAMRRKLESVVANYPKRVERALVLEGYIELTEMQRRTPVDTRPNAPHPGQLRNSLTLLGPLWVGTLVKIRWEAGGLAFSYAIHVHENPDAIHPVGEWQFMASVIKEARGYMLQRLAARLQL